MGVSVEEEKQEHEKEEWKDASNKRHQEETTAVDICPAAEKEEHLAPLTAVAQEEEAPAPLPPDFDEQESEDEEYKKAFALLGPTAAELVIHKAARRVASDIVCKAMAVIQEMDEQPQEQGDTDKSRVDVTVPARRPAAVRGTESPVPTQLQLLQVTPTRSQEGSHGFDEQEPGTSAPPDKGASQQPRPSRFRRALKTLRRAFRCSCIRARVDE
ncbi:uncharacterized protein [Melopsittacus undulatus]|uniref:uncharacterized protein n=1 Tax=Melopsittacus undulatus TaxID=13146 RepID=UPI00146AEC49|nr:uncharacterized protein LOC115946161 [Melopsittacus undulatus]